MNEYIKVQIQMHVFRYFLAQIIQKSESPLRSERPFRGVLLREHSDRDWVPIEFIRQSAKEVRALRTVVPIVAPEISHQIE